MATTPFPLLQDHRSRLETDPLRNFKFLVEINHTTREGTRSNPGTSGNIGFKLGFVSVGGLVVNTDPIQYRQGGYNTTAQQIPGQTTFSPVTLQRGVLLGTRQNWDWMRQLFSTIVGQGDGSSATNPVNFRATVSIHLLHHPVTDGATQISPFKATLYNAWPTSISYSDMNAGDNAFLVEQMTLVHEGFTVDWAHVDKRFLQP